jgi:integrase
VHDDERVLLNTRGDPWQPTALRANFARALRRAGLADRGLVLYSTRHTFATAWTGTIRDLQAALGHTQLATTMRYANAVEDCMNRAVAAIDHGLLPKPARKAQ